MRGEPAGAASRAPCIAAGGGVGTKIGSHAVGAVACRNNNAVSTHSYPRQSPQKVALMRDMNSNNTTTISSGTLTPQHHGGTGSTFGNCSRSPAPAGGGGGSTGGNNKGTGSGDHGCSQQQDVAPMAKWPAMMNLAGVANGEVMPGQLATFHHHHSSSSSSGGVGGGAHSAVDNNGVHHHHHHHQPHSTHHHHHHPHHPLHHAHHHPHREDSGADSSTGSFCSPDGHSGQKSPHKEVSPKMNKSRNEKFHKLFKIIPEDEVVLNAYSCAYFGDILLQGNLYISPNWFCFHSRILGHEKLIEIHVTKVINITREKTAFIIPNAIGIRTADDKFVFGSLMSRDSTYKLMVGVWKQSRVGGNLDTTKDTGDEDVSDNNGSLDDPSIGDNNNELTKTLPGGSDVSEDTSDFESDINRDVPDHIPKPRAVNNTSPEEQTREKKVKDYIPYSILSRPVSATSQLVCKVTSMPRTSLLLAMCGILVLLLMLSAVVMTYKIMVLQARLDSSPGWSDSPKTSVSGDTLYRDVYFLNNQYHTATVERFHSVVRANIELLGQVHNSLKSLQSLPPTTSAEDSSCLQDEASGSSSEGATDTATSTITQDTKLGDT